MIEKKYDLAFDIASSGRPWMIFPKIFKGEHAKNKKMSTILTGKKITVTFTHPMALQIDGETVKNVTTYTVEA